MMSYGWLTIVSVLVAELLCRLPLILCSKSILRTSRKSMQVISSRRISDHWKEKVLLKYAGLLFKMTFQVALWMVVAFSPAILLFLLGQGFLAEASKLMVTLQGILFMTLVSVGYIFLRGRFA